MRKFLRKIKSGDNKLSFKQNVRGIWYCDGMDLYCMDLEDGVKHAGTIISAINRMLFQKNKDVKDKESKKETKKEAKKTKGKKEEKDTLPPSTSIGR